jgi:DNA polymerase-3 subunit delta'
MPLASIIGHASIVDLLRRAVSRGRVPQSLLFAGPEGVGKRAVAVALAQAVNCPTRKAAGGDDACGKCPTCRRIERGLHTDVTVVDKGGEPSIKITVLRDRVLDVIGYRPFEAERRVYIIDPADEMTEQAQDALLKTLEEPPRAAILILISAYPDTLPATVQSRCRRLRFGPLSEADVERVLVERERVDRTDARVLAAASGGSVGRALAAEAGELATDRDAALALVAARRARLTDRLKTAAELVQHKSKRRDREALGTRLAMAASLLRDLGALIVGAPSLANSDFEAELRRLAPSYDLSRIADGYAAIVTAQEALDRNASPKIVADWIAVQI